MTIPRNEHLALVEVQVYADYDFTKNVALGKYATQSSTNLYGYGALEAVNGETGAYSSTWAETKREPHPWWVVDLGESLQVTHVIIWNRTDGRDNGWTERLSNARIQLLDSSFSIKKEIDVGSFKNEESKEFSLSDFDSVSISSVRWSF